ncbi:sulfite exporter TauE/SafE family protein [Miltoncostaea marina]|uniref:sulfite exporter TauE/SafE family protein n=1 Tax=Miltoncostaea marina TaxID=2843215 RepID=UPI001C3E0299|nr:sulfite exporter TauE/SafE family protein [Miltoncostaea marina]
MLLAIPFGLAMGLAVGTLGGGGSVLAVPILVYVLDQSVPEATTASLLVVAVGAVAGGLSHARAGRVCWRHAGSFTAAAVPGIALGTLAGEAVGGSLLLGGFALVMLAAAHATWRKSDDRGPEPDGPWERTGACPPLRLPRDIVAGAAVGFLTGLFGVGGGFLIVPTLAIALAFTMRTAVGTSLAIITATSLLGLGAHLIAGRSADADVTTVLAIACAAGAVAGASIAGRIPQRLLGRGFALLVVAVAAYLLVSVAFLGGPPGAS